MKEIFVFHVRLAEVAPVIWRRLEIRAEQTFWSLHCAIQDAMPWEDKHLHEFRFPSGDQETRIGIPGFEVPSDEMILASWETPLRDWFVNAAAQCTYLYDFGDSWLHTVTLEARHPAEGGRYPRCTGGERSGPPEDVGGSSGYARFLEAITDRRHPDHRELREWIGKPWAPELFRPEEVVFSRPSARLRRVLQGV